MSEDLTQQPDIQDIDAKREADIQQILKELEGKSPKDIAEMLLTERERRLQLEVQIEKDELTGLDNNRGWNNKTQTEFAQAARRREPVAAFGIDLDKLKWVNDQLGHDQGDAYLKLFGEAMKMSFRKEDITAHLHGDEFAALASGMTKDQADFAMARLRRNMDDLINLTMPDDPFFSIVQAAVNDKITLGASIGVAVREWKEEDKIPSTKAEFEERVSFELSQLNKDADRKMYEDKMSRRVTRE